MKRIYIILTYSGTVLSRIVKAYTGAEYSHVSIGLPEKIYSLKPAKTSDFTYSNKLNKLDEPKNIVEIIECIVQKTKKIFEKSNKDYNIVQTKGVSE